MRTGQSVHTSVGSSCRDSAIVLDVSGMLPGRSSSMVVVMFVVFVAFVISPGPASAVGKLMRRSSSMAA